MILERESKPTTMDEIENNWIIEHARQVNILKYLWILMPSYDLKTVSSCFASELFDLFLECKRLRSIRQCPKSICQRPTGQFINL